MKDLTYLIEDEDTWSVTHIEKGKVNVGTILRTLLLSCLNSLAAIQCIIVNFDIF